MVPSSGAASASSRSSAFWSSPAAAVDSTSYSGILFSGRVVFEIVIALTACKADDCSSMLLFRVAKRRLVGQPSFLRVRRSWTLNHGRVEMLNGSQTDD